MVRVGARRINGVLVLDEQIKACVVVYCIERIGGESILAEIQREKVE